ncbi:MAG: hypothetical protein FWC36_01160 [Spirochaetes bacterium]|nr:hypothetical protein [Spirochaetota bacterium]
MQKEDKYYSKKQQNSTRFQLIFMWLFVFAVYLPFFVFMLIRHDICTTPISVIGWHVSLQYLILYIILTLPFCLYLLFFFNKYFIGNKKTINIAAVISAVFITVGALIPLTGTENMLLAHTIISVSSSIILMLIILFALILHAVKKKHKAAILFLYGIYIAALLIAFYILYTAALFQLAATLSFFLILLFINTSKALVKQ